MTGKPVMSDLRARKKSLPVAYALSSGSPRRRRARRLARRADHGRRGRPTPTWPGRPGCVEAAGGRSWTAEEAGRRLARAEQCLDEVGSGVAREVVEELRELARFVVTRES